MSAVRNEVWVSGVGLTAFGRQPGANAIALQARAASKALWDAGISRASVDGIITGYATTMNHLMPANVLAEYLGLRPRLAFGMSVGGATGLAMIRQGAELVRSGVLESVLIVGGENRATGQSSSDSAGILAGVGQPDYETPLGVTVPAYYALLESEYLARYGLNPEDLAPLAVQMREHAQLHQGAHFRQPISVEDVLNSRLISDPLRLLDCCPLSDGGAAVVLTGKGTAGGVRITGLGSANLHQHVSASDPSDYGAARSAEEALEEAGIGLGQVDYAGVYDSFTVTLAILLEELGFVERGSAGMHAREGSFSVTGPLPLNTHGGLLSYGHSGVAGGMAHFIESVFQLRGEAGARQVPRLVSPEATSSNAFLHGEGGVLSAHMSLVLNREGSASKRESSPEQDEFSSGPAREPDDWTTGHRALKLGHCPECGQLWYLPRFRCPQCGTREHDRRDAAGTGAVVAITRVHRPIRGADPQDRALVLVALDEGPRVMGMAVEGLQVGDRVEVSFAKEVSTEARTRPVFRAQRPPSR